MAFQPSMDNVYESNYWQTARQYESAETTSAWNLSQNPAQSGVVPRPAYADMFAEVNYLPGTQGPSGSGGRVQTLAGDTVDAEHFTHNNMQPFLKKNTTQSLDFSGNEALLQGHTGAAVYRPDKKEVECFFEPTQGLGNVCGMTNQTDYYLSHLDVPKTRNNDFPIPQVKVGPGIGQGFSAAPSGGKNQSETLNFVRPKTVDELRPKGNAQKTSFESRLQGHEQRTAQRGQLPNLSKNRPDTYYENNADDMLPNKNVRTKNTYRSVNVVKPTSRVDTHVPREGIVNASLYHPGKGMKDDYGKSKICVYDNERNTTQTKTIVSNLRSAISAVIAPFTDIFRRTPKEYFVDAPRTFGQFQTQMPAKATLYDPVDHAMKTTIKETTIHDTTVMNLHGNEAGRAENPDPTKPTVRETMPVEDTTRNVSAHTYRVITYNPDAVAKATFKEMVENNPNQSGYVRVPNANGAYDYVKVDLSPTQKEFVSDNDYYGTAGSKSEFLPPSHENVHNAEIDGTREMLNMKSGYTPNALGANQAPTKDDVDMQMKRALSDDYAAREFNNITHVSQQTKNLSECTITKPANSLPNQGEDRLDPNLLSALKQNPFSININPITECP